MCSYVGLPSLRFPATNLLAARGGIDIETEELLGEAIMMHVFVRRPPLPALPRDEPTGREGWHRYRDGGTAGGGHHDACVRTSASPPCASPRRTYWPRGVASISRRRNCWGRPS